jgi:large subunit ribosomal protein L35
LVARAKARGYKAVLPRAQKPPEQGLVMSKMKTKSGAKKRFKITAKGKVLFQRVGKRHRLISNSPSQTRRLRGTGTLDPSDAKVVKKWMPYG